MSYVKNLLIWADQGLNAVLAGSPDETLSARAYRLSSSSEFWFWSMKAIDLIFFWQTDHCRRSYEAEQARRHLPKEYRSSL